MGSGFNSYCIPPCCNALLQQKAFGLYTMEVMADVLTHLEQNELGAAEVGLQKALEFVGLCCGM